MKIVIINGSPRKCGSTAYILHVIEKNLLQKGASVIFFDLSEQSITLCKGCCSCYKTGHCIINDDAEKISQERCNADGVIIGSSTIASNVPGVLKVFIDRGHFVIEQLLHRKYALSVTTYENYGGKEASGVLNKLLRLSGAVMCGSVVEKIPFNSDCSSNSKLNSKVKRCVQRLYNDIEQQKNYRFQRIKRKLIFGIGLKPFVLHKGDSYAGVKKRWSQIGLL